MPIGEQATVIDRSEIGSVLSSSCFDVVGESVENNKEKEERKERGK
jgi:hypothetical protein